MDNNIRAVISEVRVRSLFLALFLASVSDHCFWRYLLSIQTSPSSDRGTPIVIAGVLMCSLLCCLFDGASTLPRSWPGVHCLSRSCDWDADLPAVVNSLFLHGDPAGTRQWGIRRKKKAWKNRLWNWYPAQQMKEKGEIIPLSPWWLVWNSYWLLALQQLHKNLALAMTLPCYRPSAVQLSLEWFLHGSRLHMPWSRERSTFLFTRISFMKRQVTFFCWTILSGKNFLSSSQLHLH